MKHTTRLLIAALAMWIVSCLPSTAQEEFTYNGDTGPGYWSTLEEDFGACAASPTGHQSPINIDAVIEDPRLDSLNLLLSVMPFTLINNGHSIMATPKFGGTLRLDGDTYTLTQFHFHTLSEHTVDGNRGVMELHAVFTDANNNNAVIGLLYKIGKPNLFLQQLTCRRITETNHIRTGNNQQARSRRRFHRHLTVLHLCGLPYDTAMLRERENGLSLKQWAEVVARAVRKRFGRILAATIFVHFKNATSAWCFRHATGESAAFRLRLG